MQIPVEQTLLALLREAREKKLLIAIVFGIISLSALVVGAKWPNTYVSESTLFADEKNIIGPLLKGSTSLTRTVDHASYCREVIFSRVIMDEVLLAGGWLASDPSPVLREQTIRSIEGRTVVKNIGKGLISISYRDADAERAFRVTLKFAEAFLSRSAATKKQESQEAYDFVSSQVNEYHEKLQMSERRLKDFRSTDMDTRPGSQDEVYNIISEMKMRLEEAQTELKEEQSRKRTLERQLAGEAKVVQSSEEIKEFNAQIASLQEQLRRLRLNYLDTYPDIIRIKQQIEGIQRNIKEERSQRQRPIYVAEASYDDSDSSEPKFGALYEELRSGLSKTTREVGLLKARISGYEGRLAQQIERAKKIHDREAELAELSRDYEVNQKIYQDLLHRREAARVSMHLDMEGQGLKFRIQEPANLPLVPSGLRFAHFFLAGPMLGMAIPLGLIFGIIQLDPRVRLAAVVSGRLNLPVLETIPHVRLPSEQPQRQYMLIAGIVATVIAVYGFAVWAKFTQFSFFG